LFLAGHYMWCEKWRGCEETSFVC